ncbi:uncharacterized protein [Aegilops tauschii subsp. strangulata]|uniref:uncharacterized protein isoform X1 n=1 Tax=Aegilops tauschii subsp. strangulata TaxID=200361 RepID=UPI00098AB07E|nr:uncharacterized protein LOC109780141 isoform X1 [Aegilops tauschii subsp. strangulata]XP_040244536.1 uncharacterized protein LOC109780141 isoform X1 [Aegilops tauschii subsp. strangulata]XP_040244538.1 uncharacterized protein LOC109780141 isoform X1 [Aegilops tauschii subsp. strangulata]XP_040244539.1 uncharacterized protein LOC109780141 isoform X1 [Aegilops tauschii subsp. strangulata]XP_045084252.1 uncharacterized protein LOC109780141 isoform X1 [Aegilops tauschii subsp. strangulata]
MVALRYAARTLGRFTLRRPQGFGISSTAAEDQQRFLPRLINTNISAPTAAPSTPTAPPDDDPYTVFTMYYGRQGEGQGAVPGLTAEQQKDVASRLVQIDGKKEELYNMISGLERSYNVSGKIVRQNGRLARHLAVLVKPKPNDPYWRLHSRSQRIMDCIHFMGGCCLGPVIVSGFAWWMTEAHAEEKDDSLG